MRMIAISDTHCKLSDIDLPDGDVLVHAGDATMSGRYHEVYEFASVMARLPHRHKIFVAGNHDLGFQDQPEKFESLLKEAGIVYLRDSSITIDGIKFYGSPWQPEFYNWAFNLPRGPALGAVWSKIPGDVDVLITHGPPHGVLDYVPRGERVGCEELLAAVIEKKPKYHIFGHIHEGYGVIERYGVVFCNASTCTRRYDATNAPHVFDL